jgi:hypothetical protein
MCLCICQQKKKTKIGKIRKNKKASREHLYYFFHLPLTLLYTITSSWCGRFHTPCIPKLYFCQSFIDTLYNKWNSLCQKTNYN